jgi:hypothetical protein
MNPGQELAYIRVSLTDNIEPAPYRADVTALRIFAAAGCSKGPNPVLFLE